MALAGAGLALAPGAPAAGAPAISAHAGLANKCVTLSAGKRPLGRLFLKPTGLGTYLLRDRVGRLLTPSPSGGFARGTEPTEAAEWSLRRARGRTFRLRPTSTGRPDVRVRAFRARGCNRYPEATVDAVGSTFRGKRRDGTVVGFADAHMHVTADLRGGGLVVAGTPFHRFGITEALGRDAEVHGDDGGLDITGNLLRSGSPAGTHDTDGWPSFAGWPTPDTYTHQQVYYRWLERAWLSGLRLLGAQVVEDEPLCDIEPRRSHTCDETETIAMGVRQLRALQDYVDAQHGGRGRGWFRLVFGPRGARRVIERGKLAVIIGAESSNPFGCSYRNGQPQCTRKQIDRDVDLLHGLGVRTIFPAHWVDNALAGAALEGGDKGTFIAAMQLSYTGAPFGTGPCPDPAQGEPGLLGGRECNSRGLTDLGDYALRRLMQKGMLIEADHLSEWARRKALDVAEELRHPLVSSHTGTGGLWTPDELRRLYGVGGVASATLDDAAQLPDRILGFRRYASANRAQGVALATDTGGFNALPGPQPGPLAYPFRAYRGRVVFARQRTGTRTFDLNRDGMAHYGLLPDLLARTAAEPRGRAALGLLYRSAESYLQMWERAVR